MTGHASNLLDRCHATGCNAWATAITDDGALLCAAHALEVEAGR